MKNQSLKTFSFKQNNDKQINEILKGKQTKSIYPYNKETMPNIGDQRILIFDNEKKACIIKITNVVVTNYKEVEESLKQYYTNINDDNKVILESLEVVEDLTKSRLETAKKIVDSNKDIFKENTHIITEINAGFNNDIFNIDDKYIIKVCANKNLEDKFDKEANFYNKNKSTIFIPKLYRYDNTKSIVPFIYEIIQKVNGKSLYYYWYKMNEEEREETIRDVVKILKEIHKPVEETYDWNKYILESITNYYNQTKHYFNEDNKRIIEKSFTTYNNYLTDNRFALIHNDLHFDNIIKDEDKLYLIDFNDAIVAPIDYDLRIIYMSKETPWKWANTEMDPLQKTKDYQNIDKYLLKYYKELSTVKHLEERMIIYKILNDIKALTKYNEEELKESVINNSKKLIRKKEIKWK